MMDVLDEKDHAEPIDFGLPFAEICRFDSRGGTSLFSRDATRA